MKVAIVQDWLVSVGGAPKVVKAIYDAFPGADVFTLVAKEEACKELGIPWERVKTSFIQKFPFAKDKYRSYLSFFPFAIEQFDLRGYDVVISSSHCVAHGVLTKSDQLHVCYCHSPVRYVWDMYSEYLEESGLRTGLKAVVAKYILHRLRKWDVVSSLRVDEYLCNSRNVARRIAKTYRRDAKVIYPNIDVNAFSLCEEKEDYYIVISRLVEYKKIDIIIEAFNQMPDKRLVVIGDGPNYGAYQKMAKRNVEVKGYLPQEEVTRYLQKARAFVFAADEDLGMVPLEAASCGTPTIAYGHGGSLETVKDGVTGILFAEQTAASVIDAISRFEGLKIDSKECRKWGERFSEERFKSEIRAFVEDKYKAFMSLDSGV